MSDDEIVERGGTQEDIDAYAHDVGGACGAVYDGSCDYCGKVTPTEQDNELDKILDVLIDSVVEARMKWHKQSQRARQDQSSNSGFTQYQSELNDADNTAKSAIKKLITADRKRVALEARIDELENNKWLPNEARWIGQEADRIAELKAQQEEVMGEIIHMEEWIERKTLEPTKSEIYKRIEEIDMEIKF